MPAALSPDNTPRAFITYAVANQNHTMMVRVSADETDGNIAENVGAFLEAMSPIVRGSTFVKFERADAGSSVRVPATWSGPTTWGGSPGEEEDAPFFYSFTGKDVAGHKVRVDLFGRERGEGDGWRLPGTQTNIADALDALRTTDAVFNTISGAGAIWNEYANMSVAQHWVKVLR